ncbi:type I polyketide synthase, partial [Mycobacterium sherrisii]|uniref:type I polyketide synthase n=2 Tax=Mycobacterium sherrisii TaxID=243061 RepID=UPI0039759B6B
MRNPVHFQHAITHAATDHHTFIEISPHPLLTQAVLETLEHGGRKFISIGTLQRDTDDTVTFRTNLYRTDPNTPPRTPHPPEPHPQLPATPWQHTRHWFSATPATPMPGRNGVVPQQFPSLGGPVDDWSLRVAWEPTSLPEGGGAASGRWLVIGDAALAAELGCLADVRDTDREPATLGTALAGVDHVLYAPPAPVDPLDVGTAYQLFHQVRRLAAAMAASSSPVTLFVITRNAQPLAEGDHASPAHGALWGLGRTLALEHPEIWGGIIDLDASVPVQLLARQVLDEVAASDGEDQVVYRSGRRHVPRLRRRPLPADDVTLDAGACQLVIGATGNIGPHLIRQLARMGATTIVAVSRNPGQRLAALTEDLAAQGVTLITAAADATDDTAMRALFDRFGADLPPLEGSYLAAFAGQPVLLGEMTNDDVTAMFAPKLDAAAVLHRLTLEKPVRHFVLFSSISGLTGSRWLAHYTATSGYLDALAYARRVMGLPATTVNWGLWQSLADAEHDFSQVSMGSGLLPMDDETAIGALARAMSPAAGVHSVVVDADWPLLAAAYRTRGSLRIVDELLPDPQDAAIPDSEFRIALRNCPPERRHQMLLDRVARLAAKVMGLPPGESLDPAAGFFQLGMDSLMSVTLQRSLSDTLGEFLPASVVFDYPSVYSLTDHLATTLPELAKTDEQPEADAYDEFSEAELLEQLSERLRGTS